MIWNNDGARMIILQYGGIFVRDGLFMPMIVNGKPPKAMKLSRAMIRAMRLVATYAGILENLGESGVDVDGGGDVVDGGIELHVGGDLLDDVG